MAIDEHRRDLSPCPRDETSLSDGQVLEQVWFAGVHSDVGGWYDERGLSNIALQWMLGKARACGMHVDDEAVRLPRHRGDPLGPMNESYTGFWRFRGSRRRRTHEGARIHRSVITRMEDRGSSYAPRLPQSCTIAD